ncbi:MAG TPA: MgtC/SapB family protein [Candidatus Polarisedimenticolaceae bacterium]|nr:MgtC/SapB family protein [Candidatus Polarisedimenticolaceae bacterium]
MWHGELLDTALKVGSAWAAGSLIGLDRSFHSRPAGFRTHALVCIASALLMLLTGYRWLDDAPAEMLRIDPTRMAQGIMTGIGFLGGGVIFREGLTVRGLTTAASVWTTAALGILFGIGMYGPAVLGTALTIGILAVFRWVEGRIPWRYYAHYAVRFRNTRVPSEVTVRGELHELGFVAGNMSYALSDDGTVFEYRTVINTGHKANASRLAERLRESADVLDFTIVPTGD